MESSTFLLKMLSQILFSCFLILAISSCCTAKKYDFSQYKDLKPATKSYISTAWRTPGKVYKYLTYGEPCTYDRDYNDKHDKATGHCRVSAGLKCINHKCGCGEDYTVWDPKVQAVSEVSGDENEHLIGTCASTKGKYCAGQVGQPGKGQQCTDNLKCAITPPDEEPEPCGLPKSECPVYFQGTCQ